MFGMFKVCNTFLVELSSIEGFHGLILARLIELFKILHVLEACWFLSELNSEANKIFWLVQILHSYANGIIVALVN